MGGHAHECTHARTHTHTHTCRRTATGRTSRRATATSAPPLWCATLPGEIRGHVKERRRRRRTDEPEDNTFTWLSQNTHKQKNITGLRNRSFSPYIAKKLHCPWSAIVCERFLSRRTHGPPHPPVLLYTELPYFLFFFGFFRL